MSWWSAAARPPAPLPALLYTAATLLFIEWFGNLLGLRWPVGIVGR